MADPAVAPDSHTADDEAALIRFVARHDAACPVCDYSLRGLQSAVCPECAAHLRLQVGSANLHVGPWFLGVVSFALGLGFDGVVSLLVITGCSIAVIMNGGFPPIGQIWPAVRILGVMLSLAGVCAAGLTLLYRRRVAWRRMPLSRQRKAAVAIFVGTGIVHAAAGALLFKIMS